MATLKCLSLFSRVNLNQAQANLYGFEVGDVLILSDAQKAAHGLNVRLECHQADFLGDRPAKKVMACRIRGSVADLQTIAAEPGVLALVRNMTVLRTEVLDFIEAAGISRSRASNLFNNDGDIFHNRVRRWLQPAARDLEPM